MAVRGARPRGPAERGHGPPSSPRQAARRCREGIPGNAAGLAASVGVSASTACEKNHTPRHTTARDPRPRASGEWVCVPNSPASLSFTKEGENGWRVNWRGGAARGAGRTDAGQRDGTRALRGSSASRSSREQTRAAPGRNENASPTHYVANAAWDRGRKATPIPALCPNTAGREYSLLTLSVMVAWLDTSASTSLCVAWLREKPLIRSSWSPTCGPSKPHRIAWPNQGRRN